jgi:NADPH-dependent 2,4-dienoyl-CoA reductase/sulfur reductase-like enzyme
MRLVVVGGVAAGLSAAARARRIDARLEITVLERGGSVSHGACGLPYYVEGRIGSIDSLVTYTPEYFRRERNICVRTDAAVARVEHGRRRVVLEGGEAVPYDRLVLATGARPRPVAGMEPGGHVFTLNSPGDGVRLREFLESRKPRRGLVIGAGYIGIEAAEALRAHGVRVTVVERRGEVLGRSDDWLVERLRKHLDTFHIELKLNEAARGAYADVVVLAAGLMPNVELAVDAGMETGRTGAMRTDERMETNMSGVYAAGDCAETRHVVSGNAVWLPLGTTANKMGRVAGANAAGARERFPGVVGTSIVRVCGLGVGFTGLSVAAGREAGFDAVSARIEAKDRPGYFRPRPTTVELVGDRRSGRLLGAVVLGEHEVVGRVNVVAAAVTSGMTVEAFGQLDLAYAPPYGPVWDPLLVAAQQLLRAL